jgi:hypothetical protein
MEKKTFKAEIKVNFKQVIIIILLLGLIASIPFIVTYIQNPDKKNISELVSITLEDMNFSSVTAEDEPFLITIPLINAQIDLTILKKNPQLFFFIGGVLFFFSVLMVITLARVLLRKKPKQKNIHDI